MSFKNFSSPKAASSNDKPDDTTKTGPADREQAAPAKKHDEAKPAQKS